MLSLHLHPNLEAGTDEAGRGCLAGPVTAAAVILPTDFSSPLLNDSKKLTATQRYQLRELIEEEATAFALAHCTPKEIDTINILQASIKAMHKALRLLEVQPKHILVDGNRFVPYDSIPHQCIVKGDGKYMNIAAASILAKTYRDDIMKQLDKEYPQYGWKQNKGYPTPQHRQAILAHGPTPHHRKSFRLLPQQLTLEL